MDKINNMNILMHTTLLQHTDGGKAQVTHILRRTQAKSPLDWFWIKMNRKKTVEKTTTNIEIGGRCEPKLNFIVGDNCCVLCQQTDRPHLCVQQHTHLSLLFCCLRVILFFLLFFVGCLPHFGSPQSATRVCVCVAAGMGKFRQNNNNNKISFTQNCCVPQTQTHSTCVGSISISMADTHSTRAHTFTKSTQST